MAKFHVNNESGDVGECHASKGKCPFGSDAEHYTSASAARRAFEVSMVDSFNQKPLPNLTNLYKRCPKAPVGMTMTYGLLNGIQEDLDQGLIDETSARKKLAAAIIEIEKVEKIYSEVPSEARQKAQKDFLSELKALAGSAKPALPLGNTPKWKNANSRLENVIKSLDYAYEKRDRDLLHKMKNLRETLAGRPYLYQGASDTRVIKFATELVHDLQSVRRASLVELRNQLVESLKDDGRSIR